MKRLVAVVLSLLAAQARADDAPPSLFFTPDEAQVIDALAAKEGNAAQDDIRLGAVLYYGPQNWALWLQGILWTPQTDRPDLHVLDVAGDAVKLRLTDALAGTRDITLKPHQTYRMATGEIVEGLQ